jgi:hypothetical protein
VVTFDTITKAGYSGEIYLVVDDEDKELPRYIEKYGEKVLVFSKEEVAKTFDTGDSSEERKVIVFARNACFGLARELGFRYFLQLDDDYTSVQFKFDAQRFWGDWRVQTKLDDVFEAMLQFLDDTEATTVAMAQNGDFIGGEEGSFAQSVALKRKAMNTFFCDAERPFQFLGRINEDVNLYTWRGRCGDRIFTSNQVAITQRSTQSNAGGMTETYTDVGTYVKSFFSVMYCPSSVKISDMGSSHRRIHHQVSWNNTCPKIMSESWRKSKAAAI